MSERPLGGNPTGGSPTGERPRVPRSGEAARSRPRPRPDDAARSRPRPRSAAPTSPAHRRPASPGSPRGARPQPRRAVRPPRPRRPLKSRLAPLFILLLVAGVGFCIAFFALFFDPFSRELRQPNDSNTTDIIDQNNPNVTSPIDRRSFTAAIVHMDIPGRTLRLADISTTLSDEYFLRDDTQVYNRFGDATALLNLGSGRVVDIVYDANNHELISITENAMAWERRGNIRIDNANASVAIGNDRFYFNSETVVLHQGRPFSVIDIASTYTVTLSGHGSTVWMIRVDAGHGQLRVTGMDRIANGMLTIGNERARALSDITGDITLTEGTHAIALTGDNIQPFNTEITVRMGETTVLDLSEISIRPGMLAVNTP